MAIPVGGIIRITLKQTLFGQQVANVFHYQSDDGVATGALTGVGQGWWEYIRTAWRSYAVAMVEHTVDSVEVRQIGGDEEYGSYAIPTTERQGLRVRGTAQALPVFVAANITLLPENRQVRPGSKRVGGLLETDNNANFVETTTLSLLQVLGNRWASPFTSGVIVDTFTPVIYRPASSKGASKIVRIVAARPSMSLTTQNSRKIGRGS